MLGVCACAYGSPLDSCPPPFSSAPTPLSRLRASPTTQNASRKQSQPSKCASKPATANPASLVLTRAACSLARACSRAHLPVPPSHPTCGPMHALLRQRLSRRRRRVASFQACQGTHRRPIPAATVMFFLFRRVFDPSFRLGLRRDRKMQRHRSCSGSAAAACNPGARSCYPVSANTLKLLVALPPRTQPRRA